MKKWLSILLCAMFLLSSVSIGVSALPETARELSFDAFAEQTAALIRDAAVCVQPQGGTYSAAKRFSNVAGAEYSEADFETARLIVCSEKSTLDTLGAVNYVSGFDNLHILQYETPAAAQSAYAYYAKQAYVDYVEPDRMRSLEETTAPASVDLTPQAATEEEIEQNLQATRTAIGADILQARLAENHITYTKTVAVAVIDTGVESEHPLLKGRVVATGKNFSSDKVGDSSEDNNGHGTHVAGIIVTNTLDNVVIQPYKVLNARGEGSEMQIYLGIKAAVKDGVQVINMSLGGYGYSQTLQNVLKEAAYQNGIIPVASAGNDALNLDDYYSSPASFQECITVVSHSSFNRLSDFSNYGTACDVAAPGENVYSSYFGGRYKTLSGTSMAAPFVSAAVTYIVLSTKYPTLSTVRAELKKYATTLYYARDCLDNPICVNLSLYKSNAQQVPTPEPSIPSGDFTEKTSLYLTCADKQATLYYRADNGYWRPYPTGGISLSYDKKIDVIAYRDGFLASEPLHLEYIRKYLTPEEQYTITDDGVITKCLGSETDRVIPGEVRGIPVRALADNLFKDSDITSIILPDSLTTIGMKTFYHCTKLQYVQGNGLTTIGKFAFWECKKLQTVEGSNIQTVENFAFQSCSALCEFDFTNVEYIGENSFNKTESLRTVYAEKVHSIDNYAFADSGVRTVVLQSTVEFGADSFRGCRNLESVAVGGNGCLSTDTFSGCSALTSVDAPNITVLGISAFSGCTSLKTVAFPMVEEFQGKVFENCKNLRSVSAPKAKSLGGDSFGRDFCDCSALEEVFLPSVTTVGELEFANCTALKELWLPALQEVPKDLFSGSETAQVILLDTVKKIYSLPKNVKIAVPACATWIVADNPGGVEMYGTSGTFGAAWAAINGSTFTQISQDTAIIEDVPAEYTDASQTLCALVVGFNRTYQWYANTEPSNIGGTAIAGATARNFDPLQYDPAPYYYCVVRSQDGNRTPVYIRTGVTANKTLPADYSRITAVKAKIPKHLEYYSAETVAELQAVLDSINYTLPISRQEEVDAYADALEQALAGLYALFLIGDINQDGKVNAVDARWALQYASGVREFDSDQCKAADVNDDEKINAVDARWILQAASGTRVL